MEDGVRWLDHALAIAFAIGFPMVSTPIYARRRPRLRAGDSATRRREYRETILWLGGMGLATLTVWVAAGRDLALIGVGFSISWWLLTGLMIALVAAGLLFLQARGVRQDERARQATWRALEPVREYLPTCREEARLFRAVSVAAGLGEELFYRGFLLWYLTEFVPLPWAVAISSALFGAAHVMHGTGATIRATLTGAALAGLYLLSGSLWASMLLHAAIDLSSGEMGLAAFGAEGAGKRRPGCDRGGRD